MIWEFRLLCASQIIGHIDRYAKRTGGKQATREDASTALLKTKKKKQTEKKDKSVHCMLLPTYVSRCLGNRSVYVAANDTHVLASVTLAYLAKCPCNTITLFRVETCEGKPI